MTDKAGGGRPSKYDPAYCDAVEADMAEGYSLTAFAGKIGVSRRTINLWMAENPAFLEAVFRAKAKRLRAWEENGLRIAKKGGAAGQATLTIFALKNMGGDEWRDKQEVEHTGADGGPIQIRRIERVIVDPKTG